MSTDLVTTSTNMTDMKIKMNEFIGRLTYVDKAVGDDWVTQIFDDENVLIAVKCATDKIMRRYVCSIMQSIKVYGRSDGVFIVAKDIPVQMNAFELFKLL